ncbi:hypothetical protein MMC10_009092 [Thelotrema lepadinum]|nr:hypothetical protein [Thelotrema lepadinum]
MSNRKARRAAAANSSVTSAADIPLAQPIRDKSGNHKTLFDLAAERQAELSSKHHSSPASSKHNGTQPTEVITTKINPDGSITHAPKPVSEDSADIDVETTADPIGPFGYALIYALTFTALHFTLDVLVHSQYRMSTDWSLIAQKTAVAFPVLLLLVYYFHPRASRPEVQALFFVGSVTAGCYLVKSSNEDPYFAVMKRAPPLGTMWVWCVLEQRLEVAVAGVMVVGGYFWWGGYHL